MNKLTTTALSISTSFLLLTASFSSSAKMSEQMERSLITICKAAKSDKLVRLNYSISRINSNHKNIALNLVCNNQSVIEFAESYGAYKTAGKLSSKLGATSITDIAKVSKYSVKFDE